MKSLKQIVQNLSTEIYEKVSDYVDAALVAPALNRSERRRLARNWKRVKRKER